MVKFLRAVLVFPRGAMLLAALLLMLTPIPASAHVKYFVPEGHYPLDTGLIISWRTALFVTSAAIALLALYTLRRLLGDNLWPRLGVWRIMAVGAPTLLAVQTAISLVHAAATMTLFSPNLALSHSLIGLLLAAVEIGIAFAFITGVGDWVAALVLIGLGPVGFLLFRVDDVLDQLFFAGIGVAILAIGRVAVESGQARPWFRRREPRTARWAMTALRVITGIALLSPAFSEKIWNPGIGAAFMRQHPDFNIPQHVLHMSWFTTDHFVLAAGITEGVIGVLLMSGILPRVVILGAWLPFNLGIPFLPAQELLGHLPILGIMYLLLTYDPHWTVAQSVDEDVRTRRTSDDGVRPDTVVDRMVQSA